MTILLSAALAFVVGSIHGYQPTAPEGEPHFVASITGGDGPGHIAFGVVHADGVSELIYDRPLDLDGRISIDVMEALRDAEMPYHLLRIETSADARWAWVASVIDGAVWSGRIVDVSLRNRDLDETVVWPLADRDRHAVARLNMQFELDPPTQTATRLVAWAGSRRPSQVIGPFLIDDVLASDLDAEPSETVLDDLSRWIAAHRATNRDFDVVIQMETSSVPDLPLPVRHVFPILAASASARPAALRVVRPMVVVR